MFEHPKESMSEGRRQPDALDHSGRVKSHLITFRVTSPPSPSGRCVSEPTVFVLAARETGRLFHFPDLSAIFSRSKGIVCSRVSPLDVLVGAEQRSPLLPSACGVLSVFISAHDTSLVRCQPAIPEYSGGLPRSSQADERADLPPCWLI